MSRVRWDLDGVIQSSVILGSTASAAASTATTVTGINLASTDWDTSDRFLVACHAVSTSTGSSTRTFSFSVLGATASGGAYSSTNLASAGSVVLTPSSGSTSGGSAGIMSFQPASSAPFIKVKCVLAGAQAGNVSAVLLGLPSIV